MLDSEEKILPHCLHEYTVFIVCAGCLTMHYSLL